MPFSTFMPKLSYTFPDGVEKRREVFSRLVREKADMQTLDIDRPEMPDLQFVLLVTALCTSGLSHFNVPEALRATMFNRCWMLIHDCPAPTAAKERVLDLREWTEVMLDAMVETIRSMLRDAGIRTLSWEHPPSETTQISTPASQPLIERLQQLYPPPTDQADRDPKTP